MRMAIRQKRRINSSLSKAYWRETLQVCRVRAFLRQERSPRPSHETASSEAARQVTVPLLRDSVSVFVFVEWLLERAPSWPRRSPSAFFNRTSKKLTNFVHLLINIRVLILRSCFIYFFLFYWISPHSELSLMPTGKMIRRSIASYIIKRNSLMT